MTKKEQILAFLNLLFSTNDIIMFNYIYIYILHIYKTLVMLI